MTQSNLTQLNPPETGQVHNRLHPFTLLLVNLISLAVTWITWLWLATRDLPPLTLLLIAVLGALIVVPLVFLGRVLLDRQPDPGHAEWVTTGVHYLVGIFLGSAIIAAVRLGQASLSGELVIPWLPPWIGLVLMVLSGAIFLLVVFNLLLKGLGLPFALSLTRQVASDWLYAWTRNPMILSALAFLVGLGLWLQSTLFIIWVLVVVSPAFLVFLRVYEERELEIRFGQSYLEYKQRTPMLWPRKPKK